MRLIIIVFLFIISHMAQASNSIEDTIRHHEEILMRTPSADAHFAFAEYLAGLDQHPYYERAFEQFNKALALDPHNVSRLFTFGTFCCRIGKLRESIEAYKTILSHYPHLVSVLYNSGFTFKTAGNTSMALNIYRSILRKNPDYEPAHLGLSFGLISSGLFKEGWNEHVWNLKKQGKYPTELCKLLQENNIAGKRILITPEGGYGDLIHFLRYAQKLKQKEATIILAAPAPLIPLLSGCPYIDEIIPVKGSTIPPCDALCTVMTLPVIFAEDEATISQNIPYIFPRADRLGYWKHQFYQDHSFKIGVCWQPDVHNDVSRLPIARRGIPLTHFYRLGSTAGISLYSLQQKEGLDQLQELPNFVTIHQFDDSFDVTHGSFMDTAAVMHALDLIITTDTATAHLAGAMGKRVWLLLPFSTDWRWLAQRTDSPWYPTMRIFKQPHPFDWHSVMREVHEALFKELSEM